MDGWSSSWRARRDELKAKKISELHAEAGKEMGSRAQGLKLEDMSDDALFPKGPSGKLLSIPSPLMDPIANFTPLNRWGGTFVGCGNKPVAY